jgi:hypothetical protein
MIENIFENKFDDEYDYDIVYDANSLYDGFLKSRVNSNWKAGVQLFELNFLPRVSRLQHRLINGTYRIQKGSHFILHEREKVRPVCGKVIDDRVVAHSLCDHVLMPITYPRIIYDNCASIHKRGILQQRDRLVYHLRKYFMKYGTNDGWILLGDFSKFYDNIPHDIVYEIFEPLIETEFQKRLFKQFLKSFEIDVSFLNEEQYAQCKSILFDKLVYWTSTAPAQRTGEKFMDKSVDIGDQTSQVVGVFYPTPIDNYVKIVRQQKFYGRYMDDFYIISPNKEELWDILSGIEKLSNELGLFLNMNKTQIRRLHRPFRFLQIHYFLTDSGKVVQKIRPKKTRAMSTKIKKLDQKIVEGDREPYDVENMIRSWLGGYSKFMSKKQFWRFTDVIKNLKGIDINSTLK